MIKAEYDDTLNVVHLPQTYLGPRGQHTGYTIAGALNQMLMLFSEGALFDINIKYKTLYEGLIFPLDDNFKMDEFGRIPAFEKLLDDYQNIAHAFFMGEEAFKFYAEERSRFLTVHQRLMTIAELNKANESYMSYRSKWTGKLLRLFIEGKDFTFKLVSWEI